VIFRIPDLVRQEPQWDGGLLEDWQAANHVNQLSLAALLAGPALCALVGSYRSNQGVLVPLHASPITIPRLPGREKRRQRDNAPLWFRLDRSPLR
jgi:hypothetical protein